MDRRERHGDLNDALQAALTGAQAALWTALPAIVQSYDAAAGTITAQPAIQAQVTDQFGATTWVNLPLLVDVPVCWQGGGGFTITLPVKAGDETLIVFSSRCIDAWWQSGGVQVQSELRMHDLSDGFAFVGVRSQARKLANVSTTAAQLRSDDGAAYIELAPGGVVNIVAPGGINTTGALKNNGKSVGSTHTHGGVASGGSTSGVPT